MFLRPNRNAWKTLSFRLAFWYVIIFSLSFSVVVAFEYFFLSSSFKAYEEEEIETELNECAIEYIDSGIDAMRQQLQLEKDVGELFLVRLADRQNNVIFLDIPSQWAGINLQQLESGALNPEEQWQLIRAHDNGPNIKVARKQLSNGHILQIGMSTEYREELMTRFYDITALTVMPAIVIGFVGGLILVYGALRPVRAMVRTLQTIIQTGKFDARMDTYQTNDELGQLTAMFNIMLEKTNTLINGMRDSLDSVAHDLRTPLTRLRGAAEIALRSEDNADQLKDGLIKTIEESESILTMLNTIMDVSEAETGAMKLDLQEVIIPDLIFGISELYSDVAEEKSISINTTCPERTVLTADRNRLQQVLANILDNAMKYTPAGGEIDIKTSDNQREVIISIKDSGIGISPDDIPRIWDRLYRCDKSRSQQGLGLGLSLVKAIVEAHGGSVKVSSVFGEGSLFSICLPKKI